MYIPCTTDEQRPQFTATTSTTSAANSHHHTSITVEPHFLEYGTAAPSSQNIVTKVDVSKILSLENVMKSNRTDAGIELPQ